MTVREAVLVGASCGVTLGVAMALYEEFDAWRARNSGFPWEAPGQRVADCRDGESASASAQGR